MKISRFVLLSLIISGKALAMDQVFESDDNNVKLCSPKSVGLQEIAQINLSDPNYIVCSRIYDDKPRSRVIVVLLAGNNSNNNDKYRCYDYNGNFQEELPIPINTTTDISIMPDNKDLLLLSSLNSPSVLVWDLKANKQSGTYNTKQQYLLRVLGLGNFEGSELMVTGPGNTTSANPLYIWDLSNQDYPRYICDGHKNSINYLDKPKDAQWFVSSDGVGEVRTWDFKGNPLAIIKIIPSDFEVNTGDIIKFINLNVQDGPYIVCGTHQDIQCFTPNGALKMSLKDPNDSNDLDVNETNKYILSGASTRGILWDAAHSKTKATLNGHLQTVNGVKLISDFGDGVAITCSGAQQGTPIDYSVRVWDFKGNQLAQSSNDPDVAYNIFNLGNGIVLVVAGSYLRFFKLTNSSSEIKTASVKEAKGWFQSCDVM